MKRKILIFLLILFATSNYVMPLQGATINTTNKLTLNSAKQAYFDAVTKQFEKRITIYKKKKPKKHDGYAITTLNIRASPEKDGKIKGTLYYGDHVKYIFLGDGWLKIGKHKYVKEEYISDKKPKYTIRDIPEYSGMKSFMDYRKITDGSSPQYKLQQYAYTGNYGIREIDGRYCVAVGHSITTKIGTYLDLILENGTVIHCVLADQKNPEHTDGIFTLHSDCASEFIIEDESLNYKASVYGDISKCNSDWGSPVVKIKVYEKRIYESED